MEKSKLVVAFVAIAIIFILAFFVWPTPYEYTRKAPNVYRVNRFTGIKEISTGDGWRTEKSITEEVKAEQEMKEAEAKLALEAERAVEAKRGETKNHTSHKIGKDDVEARCKTSFTDGTMRVIITLSPVKGTLKLARENSGSIYALTAHFVDSGNFHIREVRIPLSKFTSIVDGSKVLELEAQDSITVSAEDYDRIVDWSPVWNWD